MHDHKFSCSAILIRTRISYSQTNINYYIGIETKPATNYFNVKETQNSVHEIGHLKIGPQNIYIYIQTL